MDETLFTLILEQLKSINYAGRISYHFYNEPMLSPNLEKFVRLTKEYLPAARLDLYTNGTLLEKSNIESLSDSGIGKFTVTRHFKSETNSLNEALQTTSPEHTQKFHVSSFKELTLTNRGGSLNIKTKDQKTPLTIPCFIPRSVMVISVLGNVIPCYEDFFQKHIMGNVKEQHLLEIWNSEKYTAFRETLQKGLRSDLEVCRDCNNRSVIN